MIFHTFIVYLQILLQNYGNNQCIVMHWLKHKWSSLAISQYKHIRWLSDWYFISLFSEGWHRITNTQIQQLKFRTGLWNGSVKAVRMYVPFSPKDVTGFNKKLVTNPVKVFCKLIWRGLSCSSIFFIIVCQVWHCNTIFL